MATNGIIRDVEERLLTANQKRSINECTDLVLDGAEELDVEGLRDIFGFVEGNEEQEQVMAGLRLTMG